MRTALRNPRAFKPTEPDEPVDESRSLKRAEETVIGLARDARYDRRSKAMRLPVPTGWC
jgi:hypothetical protein